MTLRWFAAVFFLGSGLAPAQSPPAENGIVLQGGTVHTISGKVIENGSVLIRNGKIVGVGQALRAPAGYRAIDIHGQQVYPGMIDSASMVGLESASKEEASDTEELGLINPQLRVANAVNTSSEGIAITRANGVTSVVEMPEGGLLSGQMSLVHLDGSNNNEMTVRPSAALHLQFPAIVTHPLPPHDYDDDDDPAAVANPEPIPYEQAKADYDRKMSALLKFFDDARAYRQAKRAKLPGFQIDLKFEAVLPVLDGTTPLFVTAVREREIREAIDFAAKQKIKIILADAYEAYKVAPLIKSRNIPVVLGPTRTLPLSADEPMDLPFTIPSLLYKAGIKFSIATFSAVNGRNLPYQAATAVPYGLPEDEAYKAVSLNAAEIYGIANRLGSIEEGKLADLIVTNGDPLDVRTKVNMIFIDGKPVGLENRQTELKAKFSGDK